MVRKITVAAIQASFGHDMQANIAKVERLGRDAARRGAQAILPPELFQGIYFPTHQDPKWFAIAYPVGEHPAVLALAKAVSGPVIERATATTITSRNPAPSTPRARTVRFRCVTSAMSSACGNRTPSDQPLAGTGA